MDTTNTIRITAPDAWRLGKLLGAIEVLPDSPVKAGLLESMDRAEADIIRSGHMFGDELDERARAAMGRLLGADVQAAS